MKVELIKEDFEVIAKNFVLPDYAINLIKYAIDTAYIQGKIEGELKILNERSK